MRRVYVLRGVSPILVIVHDLRLFVVQTPDLAPRVWAFLSFLRLSWLSPVSRHLKLRPALLMFRESGNRRSTVFSARALTVSLPTFSR